MQAAGEPAYGWHTRPLRALCPRARSVNFCIPPWREGKIDFPILDMVAGVVALGASRFPLRQGQGEKTMKHTAPSFSSRPRAVQQAGFCIKLYQVPVLAYFDSKNGTFRRMRYGNARVCCI